MTRRRAVVLAVAASLAFGTALLWGFPLGPAGLRLYLVSVAGVAAGALVSELEKAVPPAPPSAFEQALRRRPAPAADRPAALGDLESLLTGGPSAGTVHFRLRPILRGIAASRLQAAHGVDLDANPEAARRLLGPAAWELVRPDRDVPQDRLSPGLDAADLRTVVDTLEGLR